MKRRIPSTPHELATWRKAHGLTQAELAKLLGLSTRGVQVIEEGVVSFRKPYRIALAYLDEHELDLTALSQ